MITSEFPPQPGGIGNHALHLAKSLSENGLNITVIADQRSVKGAEEAHFDESNNFKTVRIPRKKLVFFTYLKRIIASYKVSKNSELVIVSGKFSLWIGGLLSILTRKPIIAIIHGSELLLNNAILQKFTRWSLKRNTEVVAVSTYTQSLIADLNLKKCTVIPNGFSLVQSEKKIVRKSESSERINLLTVGNLTPRKGQHNVIRHLPKLLRTYKNIHYHMVGIPTYKKELLALAQQLDVEEYCTFYGRISEQEKINLLGQATVFVMLSERTQTGDVEGFGIAVLEANALGVPAIGSKGCGLEDAICQGVSGFTIEPSCEKAFAKALDKILNGYQHFSTNAITWSDNFRWDKIIPRYISIIKRNV